MLPRTGFLACGVNGEGRLASLDKIFEKTVEVLTAKKNRLKVKKLWSLQAEQLKKLIRCVLFQIIPRGKWGLRLRMKPINAAPMLF